jgi:L-fucose isomerase-like protein
VPIPSEEFRRDLRDFLSVCRVVRGLRRARKLGDGDARVRARLRDIGGSRAVVEVPRLQQLMRYICKNGFEHHAAMSASHTAGVLTEALETYLGWKLYRHEAR